MPDFPVLNSPRTGDPFIYPGRAILDHHGHIEPYVDWIAMPVRLVHTQGIGFAIELGPYTLAHADIQRLKAAIHSYDQVAAFDPPEPGEAPPA
jgi:hypothetical protein